MADVYLQTLLWNLKQGKVNCPTKQYGGQFTCSLLLVDWNDFHFLSFSISIYKTANAINKLKNRCVKNYEISNNRVIIKYVWCDIEKYLRADFTGLSVTNLCEKQHFLRHFEKM